MHGDAGHVAGDVGETLEALVPDEALGQHVERLRNIDQWRVGLGRDRRAVGIDADRAGARVLAVGRRRLRLRRRRCWELTRLATLCDETAPWRAAPGGHLDWREPHIALFRVRRPPPRPRPLP